MNTEIRQNISGMWSVDIDRENKAEFDLTEFFNECYTEYSKVIKLHIEWNEEKWVVTITYKWSSHYQIESQVKSVHYYSGRMSSPSLDKKYIEFYDEKFSSTKLYKWLSSKTPVPWKTWLHTDNPIEKYRGAIASKKYGF